MNKEKLKGFRISEKDLNKIYEYCLKNDVRFSEFVRETLMNKLKKVKKDKEDE
jgi:hypothetical protein